MTVGENRIAFTPLPSGGQPQALGGGDQGSSSAPAMLSQFHGFRPTPWRNSSTKRAISALGPGGSPVKRAPVCVPAHFTVALRPGICPINAAKVPNAGFLIRASLATHARCE